jgi:hypothetical protein
VPRTGAYLPAQDAYILEAHKSENGNIVVLLFLPNAGHDHFATGVFTGNGWMWGAYFKVVNDAVYDYLERR